MGPAVAVQRWLCTVLVLAMAPTVLAEGEPGNRRLFEQEWHSQLHHLTSVTVNRNRIADVLGAAFNYRYDLPLVQVQKSLVYLGPNYRLRRVVTDLFMGRTVSVGLIGGSIASGAMASVRGKTDFFSLVIKYLNDAFPKADIKARNGALPATPSAFMNMCLESQVDEDIDLLFVEYVVNDGHNRFDQVKPKVYERLLRKILNHKRQPAVVLVQLTPQGMAFQPESGLRKLEYHQTLEDQYGTLAQYYDLPWLSFRNAVWRLAEHHRYGYNWTDFLSTVDYLHPIDPGMKAITDMIVNLIQQTAIGLVINPFNLGDRQMLEEGLPVPMHRGNYEATNRLCKYGEAFQDHVLASDGWDLIDEGRASMGKPKWGFISHTPGTTLLIGIDTRRDPPGEKMNVMLAYLKSYEHMGQAMVKCVSGCTCEPTRVDAHHNSATSTLFLVRALATQHEKCIMGVKLLNATTSGEHKFKVSGIMMNEYTGPDVSTKLHEEQWMAGVMNINKKDQ